jgi:apolipoprotein D and lipocalin family protein
MQKIWSLIMSIVFIALLLPCPVVVAAAQNENLLKTVPNVNLERYTGLWYEIAKIPNRFQRKCDRGTTAQYALREDGKIDVINRCFDKAGKVIEAKGIARIVDAESNARLKVSFVKIFGLSLFWGDYWIIGLGEDYDFAIIGTPGRKYGWILSRTPTLNQDKLNKIFDLLREQGYNPDDFEMTDQQ